MPPHLSPLLSVDPLCFSVRFGRGRQGIMCIERGIEGPVTVGDSSCSSDEDFSRLRDQLVLLETSVSSKENDTDDRVRVSTDEGRQFEG